MWETSNITGLDIIDLVNKSGTRINSEIAYQILLELFNQRKLPMSYEEFTFEYSRFDGTLIWTGVFDNELNGEKITEEISLYITPFWDGSPQIPFNVMSFAFFDERGEIIDESEESDYFKSIEVRDEFDNVKDLLNWYKNFYLPKSYEMIMDEILPELEENLKDRIT